MVEWNTLIDILLWSPDNHNLTYITIATKWIHKPQWAVQGQWKIRWKGTCAQQWSGYRRQWVRPKQWIKDHMCALQIHTGCIGWSVWSAALSYKLQCLVGWGYREEPLWSVQDRSWTLTDFQAAKRDICDCTQKYNKAGFATAELNWVTESLC